MYLTILIQDHIMFLGSHFPSYVRFYLINLISNKNLQNKYMYKWNYVLKYLKKTSRSSFLQLLALKHQSLYVRKAKSNFLNISSINFMDRNIEIFPI